MLFLRRGWSIHALSAELDMAAGPDKAPSQVNGAAGHHWLPR
jgi:hypothetical protein